MISWLVAQDLDYDEIDKFYTEKFSIDRFKYGKELRRYQVDYKR